MFAGLLPADEFKKVSGRAPQQIQFYLWVRPVELSQEASRSYVCFSAI